MQPNNTYSNDNSTTDSFNDQFNNTSNDFTNRVRINDNINENHPINRNNINYFNNIVFDPNDAPPEPHPFTIRQFERHLEDVHDTLRSLMRSARASIEHLVLYKHNYQHDNMFNHVPRDYIDIEIDSITDAIACLHRADDEIMNAVSHFDDYDIQSIERHGENGTLFEPFEPFEDINNIH